MGPIPPRALKAAGILIGVMLAFAAVSRWTGVGQLQTPDADPVRSAQVRFTDESDGAVTVTRADGRLLVRLAPGTNGFIRGVVRSLVRVRRSHKVESDPPFALTQWSDHRLTLTDPATGESIDLSGFGKDNRAAFARLLASNSTMASESPVQPTAPSGLSVPQ